MRTVYASMTTTRGENEEMAELARMVGHSMLDWHTQIEGFLGLALLTNQEQGTTQVITYWESEEAAERSLAARLALRDRITATVSVQVEETVGYEVPFARFPTGEVG